MLRLPKFWARSLMVRAVFYTGLLTLVGTGLIAYFLVEQVTTGFYQERFDQVEAEATDELIQASNGFDAMQPVDRGEVETQVAGVLENLGGSAALPRDFVLLPLGEPEDLQVAPRHSEGFSEGVISEDLREAVLTSGQDTQLWQPVAIENEEGEDVPGVAFGIYVHLPPGEPYGLFYVYDFSSVEENVTFVFQVFLIAIAVILLMNMLIAAWITRTVVKPVSQAAEVSERIADGQLDQRLAVVGEDEIARLGLSFNRMASTLQEQITQLANLSKMQQRFVSDVSHELRTPLSTVSIAADVLHSSSEDFDPVSRRSAELLHHQVERFQALLADLLEMSRFDAGAAELALNDVDLRALAQEVLTAALPLAEQTGGELNIVVQGEDFTAEVDRRRIDRILRNLVNNAIEYSEGQPVDLVITSSPTAVGIAVRDFGIGMTPEQVDHVFDRFWRADPARARTTGGSGLGLSIATEDTRLHQGSLDPWGQQGQGACFRMVLPRRQGEPYRASPLALPPSYREDERRRITADWVHPSTGVTHDRVQEQALYQQDPEA
ncbi:MAG: MtrAB system histidine kinase MtrB [Nesterenkonia sp.]